MDSNELPNLGSGPAEPTTGQDQALEQSLSPEQGIVQTASGLPAESSIPTVPETSARSRRRKNRPSAPADDDIILVPDRPARRGGPSKKTTILIILVIVAVAAAIALIVAASVLFDNSNNTADNNSGSSGTFSDNYIPPAPVDEPAKVFNHFANYITIGDAESDEFMGGAYDYWKFYSIQKAISEHDDAFLTTANMLLNAFLLGYSPGQNSRLDSIIESYEEQWTIIYAFRFSKLYDSQYMFNYYLENGYNATLAQINWEREAILSATDIGNTVSAATAYYNYESYQLASYELARQSGCIKGADVDEACVNQLDTPVGEFGNYLTTLSGYNYAEQYRQDLLDALLRNTWDLIEELSK